MDDEDLLKAIDSEKKTTKKSSGKKRKVSPKKRKASPKSSKKTKSSKTPKIVLKNVEGNPSISGLKTLIKTTFGNDFRISHRDFALWTEEGIVFLRWILSVAVSYMTQTTEKRLKLTYDHVYAVLLDHGLDSDIDDEYDVNRFMKCEENKKRSALKQKEAKSWKKKNAMFNSHLDMDYLHFAQLKYSYNHECISLSKQPFKRLVLYLLENISEWDVENKVSKQALDLLQLVFERKILDAVSGSLASSVESGKRKTIKVQDVVAADVAANKWKNNRK